MPPVLPFLVRVRVARPQKKRRGCVSLLLGYPDSNQERQDQNLQCYHYTIAQYLLLKSGAKILLFCITQTFWHNFCHCTI